MKGLTHTDTYFARHILSYGFPLISSCVSLLWWHTKLVSKALTLIGWVSLFLRPCMPSSHFREVGNVLWSVNDQLNDITIMDILLPSILILLSLKSSVLLPQTVHLFLKSCIFLLQTFILPSSLHSLLPWNILALNPSFPLSILPELSSTLGSHLDWNHPVFGGSDGKSTFQLSNFLIQWILNSLETECPVRLCVWMCLCLCVCVCVCVCVCMHISVCGSTRASDPLVSLPPSGDCFNSPEKQQGQGSNSTRAAPLTFYQGRVCVGVRSFAGMYVWLCVCVCVCVCMCGCVRACVYMSTSPRVDYVPSLYLCKCP